MLFTDYIKSKNLNLNESRDVAKEYDHDEDVYLQMTDKLDTLLKNDFSEVRYFSPMIKVRYLKELIDIAYIAIDRMAYDYRTVSDTFNEQFKSSALKIIENTLKTLSTNNEKLNTLYNKYSQNRVTYKIIINSRSPNYTLDDIIKFLNYFNITKISKEIYPESQIPYLICDISDMLAHEIMDRFAGTQCKPLK